MAKPTTAAAAGRRIVVRHYCQGIGDCHLLKFDKEDGTPFWMLIDCGIHSSVSKGSALMDRIVADIASLTKRLDVIAITHEHVDHLSGFLESAGRFKDFKVGEVWMGWTEEPGDPQARELDKFKQEAVAALQLTSQRLDRAVGLDANLSGLRTGLDSLLGFSFGLKGERVRAMRDAVAKLCPNPVRYCEPAKPPISLTGVPGIRVYVLGPPRDPKYIGVTERASEMYQPAFGAGGPVAQALGAPSADTGGYDDGSPFDVDVGYDLTAIGGSSGLAVPADVPAKLASFARDHYFGRVPVPVPETAAPTRPRRRAKPAEVPRDQSWRRIDLDWLGVSADLAMRLDDKTNNTSLVLAFEFTDTKRVLLFTADAQVGSWLSWEKAKWDVDGTTVTGPDLLARTVYYKVGHHGSHNATLKAKGLELMVSKDLSAFIPTNAVDAKNVHWDEMPFDAIVQALAGQCSGRVIRADDPWVVGNAAGPQFQAPSGSIRKLSNQNGLWVELELA